tara:strand:- start:308 stop:1747 length:1440 start_codon:yes stop_codon:yes gene_type:complete
MATKDVKPGLLLRGLILMSMLMFVACEQVEAPIVAGMDSPDQDLVEHLTAMLEAAQELPQSGQARGRLGMAYDVNGLREAALATYEQAETLAPDDFRWPYFRAQLIAEVGDHEQALSVLERALAIDDGYTPAWLWQGTWLLRAGPAEDALVAFERAESVETSSMASFGRAQALVALGRNDDALAIMEPLVDPSAHPQVHRTLGEALRNVGRTEEASRAFNRGKETDPLSWPDVRRGERNVHVRGHASYQRAQLLSAAGRLDEALDILYRLQKYHPSEECGGDDEFFLACNLMNSLSIAYDREELPEKALATLEQGLSINPDFIPFHFTKANLHRNDRDLEKALLHIDRAIELNPARGYAHEQRGRLLIGLERYDEAKAALETALDYEPEKRTTLVYLGLTAFERRQWKEAEQQFRDVIRVEPDSPVGYTFLARSLAEMGRVAEAWQVQRQARDYGADPEEVRMTAQRLRQLERQPSQVQ